MFTSSQPSAASGSDAEVLALSVKAIIEQQAAHRRFDVTIERGYVHQAGEPTPEKPNAFLVRLSLTNTKNRLLTVVIEPPFKAILCIPSTHRAWEFNNCRIDSLDLRKLLLQLEADTPLLCRQH